jgi:hypothetical protein
MRLGAFAIATGLVLALPATGGAVVRSELDRLDGMRLTLSGRALISEIVNTPHVTRSPTIEERLYGRRVTGACGTTFRAPVRRGLVFQKRVWPTGARRLTFTFARDISPRVKWCLVDGEDGADAAFISFIDKERSRLVAKGRAPSGEWWRLRGFRGEKLQPCLSFRTAESEIGYGAEYDDFSEREATLRVEHETLADRFVFGVAGRSTTSVRVRLADGSIEFADLFERPRGSRVRASYFMLALPRRGPAAVGVRAVDAAGNTVGRKPIDRFERG